MHQIFYIDIDEEITSVIDRLKKSKTTENFFVVSPRSLILQSVVSLKLLKREAVKESKQIAIVVNDKEASMKAEKAGILVLSSLKGLEGGEEVKEKFSSIVENKEDNKNKYINMEKSLKKNRLQGIGTDDFFSDSEKNKTVKDENKEKISDVKHGEINTAEKYQEPVAAVGRSGPKNFSDVMPDLRKEKPGFSYIPEKNFESSPPVADVPKEYGPNKIGNLNDMDPYKERLVEGFFNPDAGKPKFEKEKKVAGQDNIKQVAVSGNFKKIILIFAATCIIVSSFVFAYLFLPKATIVATNRSEEKKLSLDAKGGNDITEVKINDLMIPIKIIEKEASITESYKPTGKKTSSSSISQKAKGKVTIYNEYSKDEQPLVATTRILSADNKLFRLVKGVTVPGASTSGSPGSVEADVIADQPGEDYNIGTSDFKIPGFEDGPKYDKFYAKSVSAMSGGGSGSSGGVSVVSQNDLENAKKDAELKLKDQLDEEVKNEAGSGNIILLDSSEKNILESSSTSKLNETSVSFDYKAKGKIRAVIFSESDLKKLIGGIYNDVNKDKTISDYSVINLNYGMSSSDFNAGTMVVKIDAVIPVKLSVDWNGFKDKMLGKNDEEIKEILKEYPQVEKINIDYWPRFMSQKIPSYGNRVDLKLENASN